MSAGWFPHLPDQSQYNPRLRGLVELISIVQQQRARGLDAAVSVSGQNKAGSLTPSTRRQRVSLHGKEGVNGSSPLEGLQSAMGYFCCLLC